MTCDTKKILSECSLGPLTTGRDYPRGWSLCSDGTGVVLASSIANRDTANALAAATQAVPVLCEELDAARDLLSAPKSASDRVILAYEDRHVQYGIVVVAGIAIGNAVERHDFEEHARAVQRHDAVLAERERSQSRLDAALAAYRAMIDNIHRDQT